MRNSRDERKEINTKLYDEFKDLVWYSVHKWKRSCRLSEEEMQDIVNSCWVELFKLSPNYHNKKGMNLAIRHKLNTIMQERVLPTKREMTGTIHNDHPLEDPESCDHQRGITVIPVAPDDVFHYVDDEFDCRKIEGLLHRLPSSERCVLELMFGLNGALEFYTPIIAKKLGHSVRWVYAKRESGLQRLRKIISMK